MATQIPTGATRDPTLWFDRYAELLGCDPEPYAVSARIIELMEFRDAAADNERTDVMATETINNAGQIAMKQCMVESGHWEEGEDALENTVWKYVANDAEGEGPVLATITHVAAEDVLNWQVECRTDGAKALLFEDDSLAEAREFVQKKYAVPLVTEPDPAAKTPKTPSDEDFEAARDWVQRTLPCDELAAQRVLRYLVAQHDAPPAPVTVPEDVLKWARSVAAGAMCDSPNVVADFILSLVPEPVVEWRKERDENRNTVWEMVGAPPKTASVLHSMHEDLPAWHMLALPSGDIGDVQEVSEWFPETREGLAAAKARAEELCGVSTKKGG